MIGRHGRYARPPFIQIATLVLASLNLCAAMWLGHRNYTKENWGLFAVDVLLILINIGVIVVTSMLINVRRQLHAIVRNSYSEESDQEGN
jgi:hypothetical protein